MTTVMDGANGRFLSLDHRSGTADDLRYLATLTTEAGECTVGVWEHNSGLVAFIRALADDWRGFDGERSYSSIENHLTLTCRHDGLGTVECRVTVGQVWPPVWSMAADLDFGAGAHLERIADEVEQFFGDT